MYIDNKIWLAQSDKNCYILPKMANKLQQMPYLLL